MTAWRIFGLAFAGIRFVVLLASIVFSDACFELFRDLAFGPEALTTIRSQREFLIVTRLVPVLAILAGLVIALVSRDRPGKLPHSRSTEDANRP